MGIFDEAIREHLELKRQHGAGDPELQQLEDEAFGPPVRPGGTGGDTALAEEPAADEAPTTLQPAEAPEEAPEPPEAEPPGESDEPLPEPAETSSVRAETEEHPPPEGAVEAEEPPIAEPVSESPAPAADQPTELYEVEAEEPSPTDAGEGAVEDEFFSEQSLSDELDQALEDPGPLPEPEPAPDRGEPPESGSDDDVPVEQEPFEGEAQPEDGEDVLEETPEFLQDTPEHDRLWFEQKPPKDFNFDD